MDKQIGGIAELNRLPNAVFIIDIHHEHLALAESRKLGIKTLGMVDTNSDPTLVDFPIPSNDDASKSIYFITNYIVAAIKEGLDERKAAKGEEKE
jgi:small subunit ribosomal protein S2